MTLLRLVIRQKLLEWRTHSDTESSAKADFSIRGYVTSKFVILNFILLLSLGFAELLNIANYTILVIWMLSPIIGSVLSKPYPKVLISEGIKDPDKLTLYASKIWKFFDKYTTEESNFLPPDNIQLIPERKIAYRTSPTNIGFYLLSILSAYDLNFIDLAGFVDRLTKTLTTLQTVPKYKGHIYNWYDLKKLEPLNTYISTVDSGNFVASLMLMESACKGLAMTDGCSVEMSTTLTDLAKGLKKLYEKTDFTFLYNSDRDLFSVGYDVGSGELDRSYYDLLASEARIASYVAVALDQVPVKHWTKLGRPLQIKDGSYYLMSWGGTMFEYLLPTLLFDEKKNTILSQTIETIVKIQKEYAQKHNIPWGISESSFDAFDFEFNYQYKMMGVPDTALKRYEDPDLVVSPYSTFLALMIDPVNAEQNLKVLEE